MYYVGNYRISNLYCKLKTVHFINKWFTYVLYGVQLKTSLLTSYGSINRIPRVINRLNNFDLFIIKTSMCTVCYNSYSLIYFNCFTFSCYFVYATLVFFIMYLSCFLFLFLSICNLNQSLQFGVSFSIILYVYCTVLEPLDVYSMNK